jgi:hypothetical protein
LQAISIKKESCNQTDRFDPRRSVATNGRAEKAAGLMAEKRGTDGALAE